MLHPFYQITECQDGFLGIVFLSSILLCGSAGLRHFSSKLANFFLNFLLGTLGSALSTGQGVFPVPLFFRGKDWSNSPAQLNIYLCHPYYWCLGNFSGTTLGHLTITSVAWKAEYCLRKTCSTEVNGNTFLKWLESSIAHKRKYATNWNTGFFVETLLVLCLDWETTNRFLCKYSPSPPSVQVHLLSKLWHNISVNLAG